MADKEAAVVEEGKPNSLKKTLMMAVPAVMVVIGLAFFFLGEDGRNSANEGEIEDPRFTKAKNFITQKQYDMALYNLDLILKEDPNNLKSIVTSAHVKFLMEKHGDAKTFANRALEIDPNAAGALAVLGELSFLRAHFDDALKYERQALKNDPTLPGPYVIIGNIYLRTGKTKNAEQVLEQAAKLDPDNAKIQASLSSAYLKTKNYKEAQEHAKVALEIDPLNAGAHFNLARTYLHFKNSQLTLKHAKRAEEIYTEEGVSQWAAKARQLFQLATKKFKMTPEDLQG